MSEEIKEILELLKKRANEEDWFEIDEENSKLLYKYITDLQDQLHKASLDIQELTERDIECPSWCDKLSNLQEENKQLKELKYKFFYCSDDEESFTLEDYLELGNKLYDLEEENNYNKVELKVLRKEYKEYMKKAMQYQNYLEEKLNSIDKLINTDYGWVSYYYKYNNKYLKSEIKEDINNILKGSDKEWE